MGWVALSIKAIDTAHIFALKVKVQVISSLVEKFASNLYTIHHRLAREWTTKAAATLFVNLWSVENKWKVVGCLCWGWEPSCWCVLCVKSLGDWNATSFSLPNSHISCVLSVRKIKVTANRFYCHTLHWKVLNLLVVQLWIYTLNEHLQRTGFFLYFFFLSPRTRRKQSYQFRNVMEQQDSYLTSFCPLTTNHKYPNNLYVTWLVSRKIQKY